MYIPIAPNADHESRKPLNTVHPLPWSNCYVETTSRYPVYCRITTAERDYTPILPMDIPDVMECCTHIQNDREYRRTMHYKLDKGSLTALASLPLPPSRSSILSPEPSSPTSASRLPLPPSPSLSRTSSRSDITDPMSNSDAHSLSSKSDKVSNAESVSIIGSDDNGDVSGNVGVSQNIMLFMEDIVNDSGDVDEPVVNIWYDLDMAPEINDPDSLFEELDKIKQYVALRFFSSTAKHFSAGSSVRPRSDSASPITQNFPCLQATMSKTRLSRSCARLSLP